MRKVSLMEGQILEDGAGIGEDGAQQKVKPITASWQDLALFVGSKYLSVNVE